MAGRREIPGIYSGELFWERIKERMIRKEPEKEGKKIPNRDLEVLS